MGGGFLLRDEVIRIGYACINTKLPSPNRTCPLKNATRGKILELTSADVAALGDTMKDFFDRTYYPVLDRSNYENVH
jgi:hypothetical protein